MSICISHIARHVPTSFNMIRFSGIIPLLTFSHTPADRVQVTYITKDHNVRSLPLFSTSLSTDYPSVPSTPSRYGRISLRLHSTNYTFDSTPRDILALILLSAILLSLFRLALHLANPWLPRPTRRHKHIFEVVANLFYLPMFALHTIRPEYEAYARDFHRRRPGVSAGMVEKGQQEPKGDHFQTEEAWRLVYALMLQPRWWLLGIHLALVGFLRVGLRRTAVWGVYHAAEHPVPDVMTMGMELARELIVGTVLVVGLQRLNAVDPLNWVKEALALVLGGVFWLWMVVFLLRVLGGMPDQVLEICSNLLIPTVWRLRYILVSMLQSGSSVSLASSIIVIGLGVLVVAGWSLSRSRERFSQALSTGVLFLTFTVFAMSAIDRIGFLGTHWRLDPSLHFLEPVLTLLLVLFVAVETNCWIWLASARKQWEKEKWNKLGEKRCEYDENMMCKEHKCPPLPWQTVNGKPWWYAKGGRLDL